MSDSAYLFDAKTGVKTCGWYCDSCGEFFDDIKVGWLEWMTPGDHPLPYDGPLMRIVHNFGRRVSCQFDDNQVYKMGYRLADNHLEEFIGADGLISLLSFSQMYKLPFEELAEMIKRLHVPGYERARRGFAAAIAEGEFEPNTPEGYYHMSDIRATLEFMDADGRD